jgi:hypothetical protein
MGIQEVRWGKGSAELAEDYNVCMEKVMKIIKSKSFFFT